MKHLHIEKSSDAVADMAEQDRRVLSVLIPGPMSELEIGRRTDLSTNAVRETVIRLNKDGLILPSGGGAKATMWALSVARG